MILSTLMAAAVTVGTLQTDNNSTRPSSPVEKQAELMTYTLLVCRPVLAPTIWDAWLPLAFELGVDYEEISSMREHLAGNPMPGEVTEAVCMDVVGIQLEKLKSLQEQEK